MEVIQVVTNKVWGGGEQYALTLCRILRHAGHGVTVVVRRDSKDVIQRFVNEGIDVVLSPFTLLGSLSTRKILRRVVANARERCASGETPVVHVHNFKDARTVLGARTGARLVCTRHLARPAKTGGRYMNLYRSMDALIFVSPFALETFCSTLGDSTLTNTRVICNCVQAPAETLPEPAGEKFHVAYVGRLHPEKGVETIIEAMANTRADVVLDIYGTGAEKYVSVLKRRGGQIAPGRIHFHGHISSPYPAFQQANMGVFPSIAPEAFGLSAAECMACCRACAVSDSGALPFVAPEGTPVFPAGNVQEAAMAIDCLAADTVSRRRLGVDGFERWKQLFSPEVFAPQILEVYSSLSTGHS